MSLPLKNKLMKENHKQSMVNSLRAGCHEKANDCINIPFS